VSATRAHDRHLLDVNVLIALAWPNHVHHGDARAWFREVGQLGWATTPVTEAGFVRISSNPAVVTEAVTPAEALLVLAAMRSRGDHTFLVDDVELVLGDGLPAERVGSHRHVTDAHLVVLAARHRARLATLDRGLVALGTPESVVAIPVDR